ncbi:DegV family protein with EDD domain [Faecalicoccus acidiformans]|uniref:DegV family protein with EDD domain n=1 Tax=Faecalicoccus acidiformans TaxID=915173 RepID=A0A7W8FZH3_9FIRM|nr:DegV family protein [Faecalicoccus acidiformans]MBB5185002.1 DegV family protein with EDD domain [Faecalicoccus acidiformans]
MKIAFVTDTGTGKDPAYWQERGIHCFPLQIEYNGNSYDEYVTIPYKKVISNLHEQVLMKTSLPKLGLIEDTFSKLKEEGCDAVFCVPICKGLSSTFQSLEMVANQVGLKFYGVDCYVTAVVQDRMIEIAKEMIEKGHTPEEAIQRLERIAASCETVLLCDDLQHMKRGGRLTPAAAMLGGLLKIKPVLYLDKGTKGRVDVMAKVRTMTKAQDKVIEFIKSRGVTSDYTFIVAHVDVLDAAVDYAQKIQKSFEGAKVKIIDLVSAVGIHTGLGCLALQVFDENA